MLVHMHMHLHQRLAATNWQCLTVAPEVLNVHIDDEVAAVTVAHEVPAAGAVAQTVGAVVVVIAAFGA